MPRRGLPAAATARARVCALCYAAMLGGAKNVDPAADPAATVAGATMMAGMAGGKALAAMGGGGGGGGSK